MKHAYIYIIFIIVVCSCNRVNNTTHGTILNINYANGFEIRETENGYNLVVKDPFQGSDGNKYNYDLSRTLKKGQIKIPIERAVCMSTSHIAFFEALNETDKICGISGANLVYSKNIIEKLRNGNIQDIGYGDYLNYENLIMLNPDVVFAYGIDRQSLLPFEKLNEAGIPVVLVGDYLENTALGRLEWIKFFACFLDIVDYSEMFFDSVANNYNILTEQVAKSTATPNVLVGLPWRGTWYVPGGDSFLSNMIDDAGGNYIFNNNHSHESLPYSIEHVFNSAQNIDIWIHLNNCKTKNEILQNDTRFDLFKPLLNSLIYNNNKKLNTQSANDYWESGVVHPDIVLKDLISIFHPDLFINYNTVYYSKINE